MTRPRDPSAGRDIIFEFQTVGEAVRVAAIDVASGEEVVIQGPLTASQGELERVAARKLMRRLEKLSSDKPDKKTPPHGGGGVIV